MHPPDGKLAGPKLLIVDDDAPTRISYASALSRAGYVMITACDGVEGVDVAVREKPALILLDVDMPRVSGWQALAELRQRGCQQPVIMLTGLSAIENRVKGLSAGADDYLCKPCDHRELLARVHALLRRTQMPASALTVLKFGATTVDLTNRSAVCGDQPVGLTRTEYAMLDLFARHSGQLVSRQVILETVWGYGSRTNTRTVETHVWRLRRKLQDNPGAPRWIQTVAAGGGYRMTCGDLND